MTAFCHKILSKGWAVASLADFMDRVLGVWQKVNEILIRYWWGCKENYWLFTQICIANFNSNLNCVEFSITYVLSDHPPTRNSSWTLTLTRTSTTNFDFYNFQLNLSLAQLSPSLSNLTNKHSLSKLTNLREAIRKNYETSDIVQKGGVSGPAKLFIEFKYGQVIWMGEGWGWRSLSKLVFYRKVCFLDLWKVFLVLNWSTYFIWTTVSPTRKIQLFDWSEFCQKWILYF